MPGVVRLGPGGRHAEPPPSGRARQPRASQRQVALPRQARQDRLLQLPGCKLRWMYICGC